MFPFPSSFLSLSPPLFFAASSKFRCCCFHWARKMRAHTMACSRYNPKRVSCLKPSTLQQWKVSCNISNLPGSLLWDAQSTVYSAHLYNLHWTKINIFPFTVCCLHFHFNKLTPLNFCYCIWRFTLCMKEIKYFRCQGGEHLFSLRNADCSICISHSWCNTETVFRTCTDLCSEIHGHVPIMCSHPGNSSTRQFLSTRAARTGLHMSCDAE